MRISGKKVKPLNTFLARSVSRKCSCNCNGNCSQLPPQPQGTCLPRECAPHRCMCKGLPAADVGAGAKVSYAGSHAKSTKQTGSSGRRRRHKGQPRRQRSSQRHGLQGSCSRRKGRWIRRRRMPCPAENRFVWERWPHAFAVLRVTVDTSTVFGWTGQGQAYCSGDKT